MSSTQLHIACAAFLATGLSCARQTSVTKGVEPTAAVSAQSSLHLSGADASAPQPFKIMPVGDSITWGVSLDRNNTAVNNGGYRLPLWDMLQPKYAFNFVGDTTESIYNIPNFEPPGFDALQEGHPGWTTEILLTGNGTPNINNWLPANQPDIVLLMIGVNDLLTNVSLSTILANEKTLYDTILAAPSTKHLFVATLTPSTGYGTHPDLPTLIPPLNDQIRSLVASYQAQGKPITLVDQYALSGITANDFIDGLHPNDRGYAKMATVWAKALRDSGILPLKQTPQRAGDIDGDGQADVVWSSATFANPIAWLMNKNSPVNYAVLPALPPGALLEAMADFNGDGQADMVTRDSTTGQVTISFLQNYQVVGTQAVLNVPDLNWHIVGAGDFNGDGLQDLLWRNVVSGDTLVWTMSGGLVTAFKLLGTVPPEWKIEAVGDFNGDGTADIFWRHTNGSNFLWLINPDLTAVGQSLTPVNDANWQVKAAADFDGNGYADLLWINSASNAAVIWSLQGAQVLNWLAFPNAPAGWH